jgi:hypothetical protein
MTELPQGGTWTAAWSFQIGIVFIHRPEIECSLRYMSKEYVMRSSENTNTECPLFVEINPFGVWLLYVPPQPNTTTSVYLPHNTNITTKCRFPHAVLTEW